MFQYFLEKGLEGKRSMEKNMFITVEVWENIEKMEWFEHDGAWSGC